MSDKPNFEGHANRECGEHRTVGPVRAWCFDCSEWCYPSSPCVRCERPVLVADLADLRHRLEQVRVELGNCFTYSPAIAKIRRILDARMGITDGQEH